MEEAAAGIMVALMRPFLSLDSVEGFGRASFIFQYQKTFLRPCWCGGMSSHSSETSKKWKLTMRRELSVNPAGISSLWVWRSYQTLGSDTTTPVGLHIILPSKDVAYNYCLYLK